MRACPCYGAGGGWWSYYSYCEKISPVSRDGDPKAIPFSATVCPWIFKVRRNLKTYLAKLSCYTGEETQGKPRAPAKGWIQDLSPCLQLQPQALFSCTQVSSYIFPHEVELHDSPLIDNTSKCWGAGSSDTQVQRFLPRLDGGNIQDH